MGWYKHSRYQQSMQTWFSIVNWNKQAFLWCMSPSWLTIYVIDNLTISILAYQTKEINENQTYLCNLACCIAVPSSVVAVNGILGLSWRKKHTNVGKCRLIWAVDTGSSDEIDSGLVALCRETDDRDHTYWLTVYFTPLTLTHLKYMLNSLFLLTDSLLSF